MQKVFYSQPRKAASWERHLNIAILQAATFKQLPTTYDLNI